MHTCHRQLVVLGILEEILACFHGSFLIHIIGSAVFRGKAKTVGVLREQNEDLRSLKELLVYGLKGMAAYLEHVMRLGFNDDTVHVFMQRALATIAVESLSAEEWVKLVLEAGEFGVKTMALLDAANTGTYGNPEITKVNIGVKNRPRNPLRVIPIR